MAVASLTRWPSLWCPEHGCELDVSEFEARCASGHTFPVRDGIPRFVGDGGYAAPFGRQWKKYRRTQLDSHTGTTISRDRARRCIGEPLWERLEGMQVLECGCGAGRFTEVLLNRGARVTSIDMTEAVDANQVNFPRSDDHRIAQADLFRIPFEPRQYDIVLCLGVLQHTPSPEQAVAALFEHVRPGGFLVVDHYAYRLSWFLSFGPLWRQVFRRLSPERGMVWTERVVETLYPIHSRWRRYRTLLNRVSPVLTYYEMFPELSEQHQREWSLLDTHDVMTDWYKWFRTKGQVRRMLETLNLEEIWCEPGGNGIEARGRRPDPAGAAQTDRANGASAVVST